MEVINQHQFNKQCEVFSDSRSVIVLTDKGGKSEYRANNIKAKRITVLRVDDCLITDGEKCDYLLLVCNDKVCSNRDALLIELKGSDLKKAISQIDRSFDLLKDKLKGYNSISARVVLTRYDAPNLKNNPVYKRLSDKLKKHNGDIKYKEKLEDKI